MSSRGYRGRGRFQPRGGPRQPSKLLESLPNQEIGSISQPAAPYEINATAEATVEATNVVTLGSYNWVEHRTPTIVIPGSPPEWKEPELPLQLAPDSGDSFIDQNTARSPKNPFEPMFHAITISQAGLGKDFKISDEGIDIVSDRNNLRKIMRFVSANGPNRDPRPNHYGEFRIDAQLAPNGRTLVLARHDESAVDTSTRFKGYGHSFERATTTENPPLVAANLSRTHISRLKSTGYHRIIRYDLLGLRFLVRFEVDAMISTPMVDPDTVKVKDELDVLTEALARTSLSSAKPAFTQPKKPETIIDVKDSELRYVAHGKLVPQSDLIELRTVMNKFEVPWPDAYPQLFLSQTPIIKVAKHLDGRINSIQTYTDQGEVLQKTHTNMSPEFRAFVNVLTQIREIVRKRQGLGRPLALYWSGSGDLKMRVMQGSNVFSEMDLSMF